MEIILHIGYHKTATTWLQQKIFANIKNDNLNYVGRCYPQKKQLDKIPIIKNFIKTNYNKHIKINKAVNRIAFQNNSLYSQADFRKTFFSNLDKNKINLFSHENLLRPSNTQRTAIRIKNAFKENNVKIIISIRNQKSLINSRYFHDINLKLFKNYKLSEALEKNNENSCEWPYCKFSKNKCVCRTKGLKYINLQFYNFYNIYNIYSELFGTKNIHFVVFENLISEPNKELKQLFDFCSINIKKQEIEELSKKEAVNKSFGKKTELLTLYKEDFTKTNLFLQNYYQESNMKLDKKLRMDLNNLSYY